MKTLMQFTVVLIALISSTVIAQQGINYKANIKDGSGNIVANQNISIQFQILKGAGMTNVYQETHNPMTDENGIVIVNIGEGTPNSGNYSNIDWGSDDHYLNVKINTGGTPTLQAYLGKPCLILERLRLGDSEPICHQTSTILNERCPGIEEQDFANQSLYEALATRYQLAISRIDHVVRAVAADEYRAELLEVQEGTPLLFVGTTAYLDDGKLIEYSASYYRADRYEYSTTQTCCD